MASPLSAASAYSAIAKLAGSLGQGSNAPASNTNFTEVLKEALQSVRETGQKSDAQSTALANGKGNMVDVVTAVAETEVAVDAVVAVRDRVISAYEDIMKMPI